MDPSLDEELRKTKEEKLKREEQLITKQHNKQELGIVTYLTVSLS